VAEQAECFVDGGVVSGREGLWCDGALLVRCDADAVDDLAVGSHFVRGGQGQQAAVVEQVREAGPATSPAVRCPPVSRCAGL